MATLAGCEKAASDRLAAKNNMPYDTTDDAFVIYQEQPPTSPYTQRYWHLRDNHGGYKKKKSGNFVVANCSGLKKKTYKITVKKNPKNFCLHNYNIIINWAGQWLFSFLPLAKNFFFSACEPHLVFFMNTLLSRFVWQYDAWHKQKGGQDDPPPWWQYFCQNTLTNMARAPSHLCHVRPWVITSKPKQVPGR